MKDSLVALSRDALFSLRDLAPIVLVIAVFQVYVIKQPVHGIGSILIGAVLVVVGLTFFIFGFGTTIAEPALIAVAAEAAEVAVDAGFIAATDAARSDYALGLRLVVALSVGVALIIGVYRILANWSLPVMIIGGYILVILATTLAPKEIVGVAYDSGGVTTSTVTVPLVTALGVGLASSLKGRNPMTDGFGLIAFASLTPILFVLVYGTVLQWI
jgi:hypothetical protein